MLNYGLVSTAIAEDRKQLRDGMHLLADLAHKYNIPITWVITADSAQFLAKDLTEWHNDYQDEPLMMLNIQSIWDSNWQSLIGVSNSDSDIEIDEFNISDVSNSTEFIAEHLVKMRSTIPKYIRSEWKKIERAMEWTVPNVAGAEWKNQVLVQALDDIGFRGLWGYKWEERGTPAETDRGCPFGCFYPSAEQHNFSTPEAGGIIGIPYQSASHLVSDEYNLRSALINNTIQRNYDFYVDNVRWNRWLCYVEHVNASDITMLGQETISKLEEYFAYVSVNERTKLLPLSEIVDDYWINCQKTESTYIFADQTKESLNIEDSDTGIYNHAKESKSEEKDGTTVFFYYDAECQLTFNDGFMEPIEMRNYISPPVPDNIGREDTHQSLPNNGVEYHLPKVSQFQPIRQRTRLHLYFTIESTKAMPYGVAVWGNHLGLQLAKSNAEDVAWIDKYLLLIRLALEPGNN